MKHKNVKLMGCCAVLFGERFLLFPRLMPSSSALTSPGKLLQQLYHEDEGTTVF
jgi:hypothetical protein